MKISFTWSARREGNEGYVLEESSAGHRREYGPMPAHIVPAFMEGRRRIVAERAEDQNASHVPDADYEFLSDTSETKGSA